VHPEAANSAVFVAARDIGIRGTELPAVLEHDTVLMENSASRTAQHR